jgi:hypothetical protein
MIRVGLSTGSGAWSTDELPGSHQIPYRSSIVHNRFTSMNGYYGYVMALSDATGLQILENAVRCAVRAACSLESFAGADILNPAQRVHLGFRNQRLSRPPRLCPADSPHPRPSLGHFRP